MSAKSLADLPNTAMRSPTAIASSNWCVIRIAVEPHSRASFRKVSRNSAAVTSSRWPKASSASMMSGWTAKARAIATRWRMPPDSSCG